MLGFQTERACKCILPVLTQIGVILGLDFLVKQRSGYGLDYRVLAIMRGNDPRTLVCTILSAGDLNLQSYHFTLNFKLLQLVSN